MKWKRRPSQTEIHNHRDHLEGMKIQERKRSSQKEWSIGDGDSNPIVLLSLYSTEQIVASGDGRKVREIWMWLLVANVLIIFKDDFCKPSGLQDIMT